MNKKICFLIAVLLVSCKNDSSTQPDNDFTINIALFNAKNDLQLLLKKQDSYISFTLDSTITNQNKASFMGSINAPQVYGVFIEGYKQGIFPIVEKGTIDVKVDLNDLSNAKISGTKLNDQLAAYKQKSLEISSKMNELFHEFQKARAENNSEKLTEINLQMKRIDQEKNDFSKSFIKNNPDSFVASMVLHSLLRNQDVSKDTIARLYSILSKDVKKSEFSKSINLELQIDTIKKDSLHKF